MRVLYGKCFGIGNAVMAIPAIKAIQSLPDTSVDILVGNTPDDFGAFEILSKVVKGDGKVFVNSALERHYDVAVMAIPFDGRWKNGVHFNADKVMDGRTRPDPSTVGLVSWKKHESEYQMDNARELGFQEERDPHCSFEDHKYQHSYNVFLGVGYKKDAAGFWKVKHWGNENFSKFINIFLRKYPSGNVFMSGDNADYILSMVPIFKDVDADLRSRVHTTLAKDLQTSIDVMKKCSAYVGNDTGMMHVAAALGLDVIAYFALENSTTKSKPLWSKREIQYLHWIDPRYQSSSPEDFFKSLSEGAWW